MTDNPVEAHGPTHLGKATTYAASYDAALLDPIPRSLARATLNLTGDLPFAGVDLWTAFELSWLNAKGKPEVAMAEIEIPCTSPNIIESKSFKLYLNSFNHTVVESAQALIAMLKRDLSTAAGAEVAVNLIGLRQWKALALADFDGECIDELDVSCEIYEPDASLLQLVAGSGQVQESLYSDLLKTNCPVTGQPDWASVVIHYAGRAIEKAALLRYIVSYRNHQDFHEHCVESIFLDVARICKPEKLTVYARYTRRGGLDINPFRSNCGATPKTIRLVRQ